MPEVQLALVGSMATDDPEGWDFFQQTVEYADGDADIKILNNLNNVGAIEVNAFQSQSDVCLQKSIREGFGLTVTEALWKGRPTVAGNVGGIPLQIENGESGYLVDSPERVRAALPRDPRRPGAGQAAGQGGQGTRPPRVPLAAAAARLAAAADRARRIERQRGRGRLEADARLRSADHRLQPRAGAVRARRERRAHGAARRRRPGDGALRARLPPRGALDRLGDDRRGRRRLRGARRPGRALDRRHRLPGAAGRQRPRRLRRLLQRDRQPDPLVHPALPLGPLQRAGHPPGGARRLGLRLPGGQPRHRPRRARPDRGPRAAAGDAPRLPPLHRARE